jgi:phosphate transport system permease protein
MTSAVATLAEETTATAARNERGTWGESLFRAACLSAATFLLVLLAGVMGALLVGGWPAFHQFGFNFIFSSAWDTNNDVYGAAGPIFGTIATAFISLALALPLAIGVAVFLVEFCPKVLAQPLSTVIDLLAGIPSIVYGMWGFFVFAPLIANYIQLPLAAALNPESFWGKFFAGVPNGNLFVASVVLAIMVLPYMTSVFRELMLSVPAAVREAAYGLGCTPFEVVRSVMIPYVQRGMVGGTMLGLGRALGETMAVTFVIGNTHNFPKGLFDATSTIASTIANEFAEASGVKAASLIAMGLILFLITFAVLAVARMLLNNQKT